MPLITSDDIIETYSKLKQRGLSFIISKFNFNSRSRTLSAFDHNDIEASNWWNIPSIKQRWNEKISGDKNVIYENYVLDKYYPASNNLKMLSIGAGICSHEINFAKSGKFSKILCVDIAETLLDQAEIKARRENLICMEFLVTDIFKQAQSKDEYDIVLFHMSLHHFKNIQYLLLKVKEWMKSSGHLIINEYVGPNRLQYPQAQINSINKLLSLIPNEWRSRFKTTILKKKVSGPGKIRMILADPSECVNSKSILHLIHQEFVTIEEKPLGGNLLVLGLKDIAHHFYELNEDKWKVLQELFVTEDAYLQEHDSDYFFGIYSKELPE